MQLGRLVWFCAAKEQTCCHTCLVHSQGEISGCKKVAAECDLHRLEKECIFTEQGLFRGVSIAVRLPERYKVVDSLAFFSDAKDCVRAV